MPVKHLLALIAGSLLTVTGLYLEVAENTGTSFVKVIGLIVLGGFVISFYRHLKSKNETTAK
jgi:hypothetical protein